MFLLFVELYLLDGDEFANVLACGELPEGTWEWGVWGECWVDRSHGFEN